MRYKEWLVEILKFIEVTVTSRIPYKGPYVVKSQLVEQNDPFLINEIACMLSYWYTRLDKEQNIWLRMQNKFFNTPGVLYM